MAKLNKSALITQIDTIIANLNLSTDLTEELSLYYKTALNAGADSSVVIAELTNRIQTVTYSAAFEELLLLATTVSFITDNRTLTIPSIIDLDGLTDVSAGTIYFVIDMNKPYIKKNDGTWTLIDPLRHKEDLENAWAWGFNASGHLGDGATTDKSSPVSVVGGFTDWVHISAGRYHSVALRANGSAWAWGGNSFGELGDSSTINRSSPVSVVGGFLDWAQISAGDEHSLGIRAGGSAWSWGRNVYGRLGDNSTTDRSSPVSVVGGFLDWVQISAGTYHTIALRANGSAWAWGRNFNGRLGDDTTTNRSSPVSVVGGFADWIQVSAGYAHTIALRANGSAWAWGSNSSGQLGDNTITNRSSPVSIVGGFLDWIQVSAGANHSLGLRAGGSAWAWGYNGSGRLGDNTSIAKSSPVSIVGGFSDWVQVSAGGAHTIALRANGSAWSWGSNVYGRLGNDSTTDRSSPVSTVGGFLDWVHVSAGYRHTAAIRGG